MINTKKIKLGTMEINFNGGNISSDGGLFVYKHFADKIELKKLLENNVVINDNVTHRVHQPIDSIIQQIYCFIAGYEDNNDVTHLQYDKVLQMILGKDVLASQPTLCRLEQSYNMNNIKQLEDVSLELIKQAHQIKATQEMVLDLDSTDDHVHGEQEGAKYNKHYSHTIYHPLFCFDALTNDLLKVELREGNVYTSNGVVNFVKPLLDTFRDKELKSRGDSGFAIPELYELYERQEYNVKYNIKLKFNAVLKRLAGQYLIENKVLLDFNKPFYFDFKYKAGSWNKERRVLCKVELLSGNLFYSTSFIVTNDLSCSPKDGFKFYNGRANVENNIKEMKLDFRCDKLSLQSFISNACRLQVFALAYNLFNLVRRLVLPGKLKKERLMTLRVKLIKIGCRVITHAKKIIFKLSSSYTRQKEYFEAFENIDKLKIPIT